MELTQNLLGEELYREDLKEKMRKVRNFPAVPLAAIREESDLGNRNPYTYRYMPLIFCAIKAEIGEQKTWQWMKLTLASPATFTDYEFLLQTLKEVSEEKGYQRIKKQYFESEKSISHILDTLGG